MFRILLVVLGAVLSASIHRLRHGPTAPGWSWRLEWVVALQRAALSEMMNLHPARMREIATRVPSRVARQLAIERVDLAGVPADRSEVPGAPVSSACGSKARCGR